MGLPWFRVDSNIASHDKILHALSMRGGKAAISVYLFSIGWSHGNGTDGHIPSQALPMVHAAKGDAAILTAVGLWDADRGGNGWWIHNYAHRQELAVISETKRVSQRIAGRKANCVRWHGKDCGCWQQEEPPPTIPQLRITN